MPILILNKNTKLRSLIENCYINAKVINILFLSKLKIGFVVGTYIFTSIKISIPTIISKCIM